MMQTPQRQLRLLLMALFFAAAEFGVTQSLASPLPGDSIVRFDTTLGSFDVELFNSATPVTVANFLQYLSAGAYSDSLIHRSIPNVQIFGGGFQVRPNPTEPPPAYAVYSIPAFPSIVNEAGKHNVRGTISMATLPGNPNSATSSWFINTADNSATFDVQNGGSAVFGQVLGSGMDVVDAINALPRINIGPAFPDFPLLSVPIGQPPREDLVIVRDVRLVPEPASAVLVGMAMMCAAAVRSLARRR